MTKQKREKTIRLALTDHPSKFHILLKRSTIKIFDDKDAFEEIDGDDFYYSSQKDLNALKFVLADRYGDDRRPIDYKFTVERLPQMDIIVYEGYSAFKFDNQFLGKYVSMWNGRKELNWSFYKDLWDASIPEETIKKMIYQAKHIGFNRSFILSILGKSTKLRKNFSRNAR